MAFTPGDGAVSVTWTRSDIQTVGFLLLEDGYLIDVDGFRLILDGGFGAGNQTEDVTWTPGDVL